MTTKRQETMWAEMKPSCYGGETCDQISPAWSVYADGDKEGENSLDALDMKARAFPPGTKVVVSEPICPSCGELREPNMAAHKTGAPLYSGPCRCGFDWDAWVLEQYS